MLKINKLRNALINHAHTVMGRRGSVMPLVRRSMVVALRLRALARAAAQNSATLAIQTVTPVCGARKNAVVTPTSEAAVVQKASRLRVGKAMSPAPIWMGRR